MSSRRPLCCLLLCLLSLPVAGAATRPRIGLVLSGGGARGAAEVGVLKRFEEAGIPIDLIVGTSFGALVGGLYASGYTTEDIQLLFERLDWDWIFDESPDRRDLNVTGKGVQDRNLLSLELDGGGPQLPTGLQTGQKVVQLLDRLTLVPLFRADNDFTRLPVSFRAVATDILTGKPYLFRSGSLSRAIRASIAIPAVFTPVEEGDMLLVDGGVSSNLPVREARSEGAELILAVDVSTPLKRDKRQIRSLLDVLDQTIGIHIEEMMQESRRDADFLLTPDLTDFTSADFDRMPEMVEKGYQVADSRIEELWELLRSRGVEPAHYNRTNLLDSNQFSGETVPDDLKVEVQEVVLEANNGHPEVMRQYVPKPGVMTPAEIDAGASRLYAQSRVDRVSYRLGEEGRRTRLTYELNEVPRGELGLGIRYDPDYEFTGALEFRARDVLRPGGELSLRTLLGNAKLAEARLRYPLIGAIFAEPLIHYQRQPRYLPLETPDSRLREPFREERLDFRLGLGANLGRSGLLTVGYQIERVGIQPNERLDWNAGLRLESLFDNRDSALYPTTGSRLSAGLYFAERGLGGDYSFQRYELSGESFWSLGARNTLGILGRWGRTEGNSPFYAHFFAGGPGYLSIASHPFPGLERDEIRARQTAQLGMDYRFLLSDLSLSFIDRVYLGGGYRAGLFSQPERLNQFRPLLHGFRGGVYLQTHFLGPISLEIAGTNHGDFASYLSLGYYF